MVEVTQCDRDAAAAAFYCKPLLDAKYNTDRRVQAFTRHRLAAFNAGLEHAAGIAENYMADCLDDRDIQRRWPDIKRRNDVYATGIRAAKEPLNV